MTIRRLRAVKTAAAAGFFFAFLGLATALGQSPAAPKPKVEAKPAPAAIDWAESLDAAFKRAKATRRKVLIAVYAPWCGWCKVMQAKTYPRPEVVAAVNAHFVAVRLNAESRDSLSFLGQRYGYRPDLGMNELAFQLLNGRRSYPTTVFLSSQAEVLSPVRGYFEPTTFVKLLTYFGEEAYLYSAWPDYEKGPQSDSTKKTN